MQIRILDRYIFKESLIYFSICLLAFTGILFTLRMISFATLIINRGVKFSQIGTVFLSVIPTFFEIAVPLSGLLGIMLAFGRLCGDSEIVVMRASGTSILSLTKPIVAFGLMTASLTLVTTLWLSPLSYGVLSKTLFEIARSQSLAGLEQGIFNKLGKLILYSEVIDYSNGSLRSVLIDDKRDLNLRKIITAKTGRLLSDDEHKNIALELRDGYIHEIVENKYALTHFNTNSLVMSSAEMYNQDATTKTAVARELSLGGIKLRSAELSTLLSRVTNGEELKDDAGVDLTQNELNKRLARLETEWHRRFSMPYAAFVLALIALPLGIQVPRMQQTWGAGLSACLGMLVFVLYYAMVSVGVALGENGKIPIALSLWLPNIVTTLLAIYSIRQVGSERWHSIPHAIEVKIRAFLAARQGAQEGSQQGAPS